MFYGPVSAVFTAVEDVFTSNVPQDDWSPEDLFKLSYVIDRGLSLPTPWPLKSALKVLHNSLSHTVEVAIFQRGEVGRVWVSDGVEAVGNCGDGVRVLIEHTVDSSQYPRACVPSDLDDPPALLSLSPDWIKLVFKDPIIFSFFRRNLILRRNSMPPGRAARKGSPGVGHPSVQCQPAGSGMHAVGDLYITFL